MGRGDMLKKLAVLFLIILVCAGCAKNDPLGNLPDKYSGDITCTAAVCALSEPACEYTLSFARKDGTDTIEVLAPESVAGITATVEQGSAGVSYEGKYLDTLLPYYWGASPIDALSALFDAVKDLTPVWYDLSDKTLTAEYLSSYDNAEIRHKLTFDRETLALKSAEAELDGTLIMIIEVQSLQLYENN